MKHFPTLPGWLIDVSVDGEPWLGCRTTVDVVIDGSTLSRVFVAFVILLVVIFPNWPGGSWIGDVVVDDGSPCLQ